MLILWMISLAIQDGNWPPKVWTEPTEPFQIAGPVYYVGGRELTAYLIADEAGLILVNIGMEANVPLVIQSIETLGFDPLNLTYLLITQAHMDHAGGAALLREKTGVEVLAGTADLPLLKSGGLEDYVFGDELPYTPVSHARGLEHGEEITLGDIRLKTIATPGHTPGSSSWLLDLDGTEVLFQGSISVLPDAQLVENPAYPTALEDYRTSIKRLESIRADLVLPDHMVFAHPPGKIHADPVEVFWFRRPEVLRQQITRTQRAITSRAP